MSIENKYIGCSISATDSLKNADYGGIILISWPGAVGPESLSTLTKIIDDAITLDPGLKTEFAVIAAPHIPAKKIVHAPTGPIDPDYNDVRIIKNTAKKAITRAMKAEIKKPLLVLRKHPDFENCELVTLLGVLEVLYTPLQVRETSKETNKIDCLGVWSESLAKTQQIIKTAKTLESGLFIARDIGGSDPERMAPPRIVEYVKDVFHNSPIKICIIDDLNELTSNYPLFEAVNRCANEVERHRGSIVYLKYEPENATQVKKTLYLVGKGVTYDTGGADVKAGGVMCGMSRDKCGAAAVVGFMQLVKELQPKDLKITAALCLVRNSIGANCYVSDELIMARSQVRVRIGNTDAEGRMIMADVLCHLKELAQNAVNPHLYTIATLTGHACLTTGSYPIVIDNGPARRENHALHLQQQSDLIADPFEISTLRLEDFNFHRGKAEGDDVLQSQNEASTRTPRGHQTPAAFLVLASGLDKHGSNSHRPMKYSHLDIAPSAGPITSNATGSPILALASLYLLK